VGSPFLTEAEINLDGRLDEEAFGFREFTLQADGLFEKVSYRFRM